MVNALAGLASFLWGTSDFLGGQATKTWAVERVGALSQLVGLVGVGAILLFVPAQPRADDILWGVVAGVATAFGLTMLYKALAIGPMHVAAPTCAVIGALVPAVVGFIEGERPGTLASVGVLLAIGAVLLIGASPPGEPKRGFFSRTLLLAAGAGLSLGVINLCFAATSVHSGLWPVASGRIVSTIGLGAASVLGGKARAAAPRGAIHLALAAGLADGGATASQALALQRGSLVLVGVLGALFPVVTVVLARVILREAMGRRQLIGLTCAVVAVALITAF